MSVLAEKIPDRLVVWVQSRWAHFDCHTVLRRVHHLPEVGGAASDKVERQLHLAEDLSKHFVSRHLGIDLEKIEICVALVRVWVFQRHVDSDLRQISFVLQIRWV